MMGQEEKHSSLGSTHGEFKVDDIHTGVVSAVMSYGVFVQFGQLSGLCHTSNIPTTMDRAQLIKGCRVSIAIREQKPDKKYSLDILEVLPLAKPGRGPERQVRRPIVAGALIGENLGYSVKIGEAVQKAVKDINKVGGQYKNNPDASLSGFVAETAHTGTFNVDAAFQKSKVTAEHFKSIRKNSADINLFDEQGKLVKEVSSKVFKTAEDTAKAQRGYGGQDRLVPSDQLDGVKKIAAQRAVSERMKPGEARQQVAMEHEEVAKLATDRVKLKNVKSTPRTKAESHDMAQKAKKGAVVGKDVVGGIGERAWQGAKQGGVVGAAAGAGITAATSTYQAVKDVRSGKKSIGDASKDVAIEVGKSAVDGGIKGMAAGAATASARVLAERTASQGLKRVLGGAAPAAVAITSIEIAKHAIDFARGVKTAEEFRGAAASSAKGGANSFIGAQIGFLIGGPIGAIIGGIAGPMIIEKLGLWELLEGFFSSNAAPPNAVHNSAPGHDGATLFHLEQVKAVLTALRASSATVFLDRVIASESGHHDAAEIVLIHQGKVYVVNFKAWLGTLSYHAIMETKHETRTIVDKGWFWDSTRVEESTKIINTGRIDSRIVDQSKVDQYGYTHLKEHRNPLRSLNRFRDRLCARLAAEDRRWGRVKIESIVVFPDDAVTFEGDLAKDTRFMQLNDFLKLLVDDGKGVTQPWMVDGLSLVPTWDTLQDHACNMYQGLIQTKTFTLRMPEGSVAIPFESVLKIDVSPGGSMQVGSHVKVTLRDQNYVVGMVQAQEIVFLRKGHSHTFLMHDLKFVCPAYSLFAA